MPYTTIHGGEMNERIKELAEQAGSTHKQNLGVYQFYSDELEKFAELIVRECVSIVENSRIEGDEGVCLVGATKCKIEQHFGVDE